MPVETWRTPSHPLQMVTKRYYQTVGDGARPVSTTG